MGPQGQEMRSNGETGMGSVCHALKAIVRDEAGVTTIEYALLGALIAMVVLVAITAVGNNLLGLWADISALVAAAT